MVNPVLLDMSIAKTMYFPLAAVPLRPPCKARDEVVAEANTPVPAAPPKDVTSLLVAAVTQLLEPFVPSR